MIRFSLIGPLRTGSSLLTRCLDDHPELICLCESEVNRALFGQFYLKLHFLRMRKHGFHPLEIMGLLDRKRQNSILEYEKWHEEAFLLLRQKYSKSASLGLGDKSPDFYRTSTLCEHLLSDHRLIYTMRDPRAVFRSIKADDTSQDEKDRRWLSYFQNYRYWKPFLDRENLLVVKFESLVSEPDEWLGNVSNHIGVTHSARFREAFSRAFPERFLWKGVTEDADEGVRFSAGKSDRWKTELTEEEIGRIENNAEIKEIMQRFGYSAWKATTCST